MAKLQGRSEVLKLLKKDEILEGVNINFNKELGRGSYATVYQAEWRSLSCVAKVFHAVIFPSYPAETWKQLAREIELLQHIRHPNIVQLLGFTETHSKIPSVVMERLDTNLTTLIKEHHSLLSFGMQVCILHDVAVGLNFLHEEPIIHRDLSSNNILLTEQLVAKISDLGLAKHIKSVEQQAGSFAGFGTQDYMPPEVLGQKPPQISPKTDVFSFGVVMLQVATGKSPDVRGRLNVDAEADRRKHHLDLLGENNLFHPLVLQCLNNESDNRPTAVKLCKDLKRLGVARISTLKLTKALQKEKVEFKKQLEAFQLQRDSDIENMQKQLQEETMALQTKLDEEKATAALGAKKLKAKLNVALDKNIQLEKRLSTEKEIQNKLHAKIIQLKDKVMEAIQCQSLGKQLVEQNQELAELLENTTNDLIMYKKSYSALKELLDSLNLENALALDIINDKLQKCKNDRKYMSVKLEDMESHLLLIQQSFEGDKEVVLQTSTAVSANNQVDGTGNEEMLQAKLASAEVAMKKAVQESTAKDVTIKKSGGMLSTGIQSWEMALQTSGSQEHFMPAMGTTTNNKSSPFSSGDLSAYPGQKLVQPTLVTALYGMYGNATRLVGAKHFDDGIGSANVTVDNMASLSNDDVTTCPLCHVTLGGENELQLHYLQSCAGYDNEVAGDPMSTKPVGHHPPATQQNFGGYFDRSSDRLAPSSKEITVDRSRAAVGGGDGNLSGLSQRLVKFVWYPNDPFKIHEQEATLLSSFTTSEGSVKLFKDKNEDIGSYSSSTVSVRIGKFDDGQIVVGEEKLEVEPYEVSNDSEEIYLITKERNSPGPPPVNSNVTTANETKKLISEIESIGQRVTHRLTLTPSGGLKQPTKRTAKSVTKQVETANGKQDVWCEPVTSAFEVRKGQRVVVYRTCSTEYGTVRAVNMAIDAKKKGFIGVEMDLPSGCTDGEVKGVRHFKCKLKHAVFVPPKSIFKIVE